MPTTTYIHANGVKIAQVKDGVRTDYLTDALGSITATKNQSQQIVNTYRYKPYGGLLARTGTGADPKYLWTGNTGSRVTNTRFANQYNVARHYANAPAKWTTVDPLWPDQLAYIYCDANPLTHLDPQGQSRIDLGYCCSLSISVMPGMGDPIACTLIDPDQCENLFAAVKKCRITRETFCKTIDIENKCIDIAKKLGVPAKCLCAMLMAERSYWDYDPWYKRWSDWSGHGETIGCAQLSVGTAKQVIARAKKCIPDDVNKIIPNPANMSDHELWHALSGNCAFSTAIAALYLKINTDPRCTPGGKPGSCKSWYKLWNDKGEIGKDLQDKASCIEKAIGGRTFR